MYHLVTIAVGCIIQPQHRVKTKPPKLTHMEQPWAWSRDHGYSRSTIFSSSFQQSCQMSYAVWSAFLVTAMLLVQSSYQTG